MALKIITDSACDLPKEEAADYGIEVIPTPVLIEEQDYFDGKTIFPKEFYQLLRSGKDIKTYHINSSMFREAFEPYAQRGDELIYICFSTGIAGTYGAAHLAKKDLLETYPDFRLTIVDSKCASIGFGLVVRMAAQMQREGRSRQEIVEAAKWHCAHMKHVFTVDTLEYLLKGGRISKTSAIAGSILSIKPIIKLDEQGALKAMEKIRGRKRSLHRLAELAGEWNPDLKSQTVGLVHGDDADAMREVKELLRKRFGVSDFVESDVGCAIGAHTGPGIIGITFLDEQSPYMEGC